MARWRSATVRGVVLVALIAAGVVADDDDPRGLRMSKGIVCEKVHGYASFEPLAGASLTSDDKLTIYYEPSGYTIERTKEGGFRAVFSQDGRIRKKGKKDAVWKKDKMFDYEAKSKTPPYQVFMRSDLSIKGLPPGDYELDLTLRDGLKKDSSVTQTVAFKVVEATVKPPDDKPAAKSQGLR